MTDAPVLPWVSVSIGAGPDEDKSTLDLNYHSMTTQDALTAMRQMGYVTRTLAQWEDYLRKVVRNATDRMGDQLGYDERRKGL